MRKPEIAWLLERPIAHRGLHDGNVKIPENSLSAFNRALLAGYPIELDLHLLADGEVLVFHDRNLSRLCGLDRQVTTMTKDSIRSCRLLQTSERPPLIEEVFDLVRGAVPLLIELKSTSAPGLLEPRLYEKLRRYGGQYAVQSFNPFHMHWFARHAPAVARGQLAGNRITDRISRLQWPALSNNWNDPHFVGYRAAGLPSRRVAAQRRKGLPVLAWTVRSQEECAQLKRYCDNIVFECFTPEEAIAGTAF